MQRITAISTALAAILAGALFFVGYISADFAAGTDIQTHPVIALCCALALAGSAWVGLLLSVRRRGGVTLPAMILPILIVAGVILRLSFFGSDPIYENDYKRYLWDGAVTANGTSPYIYSPQEVFEAGRPGAASYPELAGLAVMSNQADGITGEINSPVLTTIYPPAAQGVFALAYMIAPFQPWALKLVFLLFEVAGLAALLAGLRAKGLPLIYASLYWLNPLVIFTTYNGLHMDVLLVAPILAALLWAGRRPFIAAVFLSLAAAIKIWPVILAPILFRSWRGRPIIYGSVAVIIAGLTAASLLPMWLHLDSSAGLLAYSANWTNSSFLFPAARTLLENFAADPDRITRYGVAIVLTAVSLSLGFLASNDAGKVPLHLFILTALFVLLSPTGYPWYFIWFLMFLPFVVSHWSARGIALLTVGGAVYFARFQLGDAGHYDVYSRILVPIEFGAALCLLGYDGMKARRRA